MFIPLNAPQTETPGLPIFRDDASAYVLFYTPGYLVVTTRALAPHFVSSSAASTLRRQAQIALQKWADIAAAPFAPVCLTLYLNNECNLRCQYCYTDPAPHPAPRLELNAVRAAVRLVAVNCRQQKRPFTLVCHGGGEPTLNQPYLEAALAAGEQAARQYELPIFRYIATNGVMTAEKARWLAQRFDLIGLSCDGPATIQAKQRPLLGGQSSTPTLERTARIIREQGTPIHVRVTITRHTVNQQTEIAHYICSTLQPEAIHVEPVYQAGRAEATDCLADADLFVAEFLKGQAVAQQYGVSWTTSGSRLDEIHGPYCHIFRNVLNLVPGGTATACFQFTRDGQVREQGMQIGQLEGNGRFHLDDDHIQTLRQIIHSTPPQCADCFNQYHCVRACPDHCAVVDNTAVTSFRCQVQKKLTQSTLHTLAESLWIQAQQTNGVASMKVSNW